MLTHFPTVTQSTGFQPEPLLTAHCSKLTAHSSLLLAQCGTGFQPKHLRWVMIQRRVRGTVLWPKFSVSRYLSLWPLWSWRGSNPRPNREPICFLHVYFRLHCRAAARPEPPTVTLSSKASSWARGIPNDYSRYSYTAIPDASEQELLSDVSFQHMVPKLGQYSTVLRLGSESVLCFAR